MTELTHETLELMLDEARISRRLKQRIILSTAGIDWSVRDFITLRDKSGNEGVMIFESTVTSFTLHKRKAASTGRVASIICDICATWQSGPRSALLTLKRSDHTATFLVCGDLDCSLHVRDMSDASRISRTQLKEHITSEARISRLHKQLSGILQAT